MSRKNKGSKIMDHRKMPTYNRYAIIFIMYMISGVEVLVKYLEKLGPLPWRPSVNLCHPIASQCRQRLIEVCGKDILSQMFTKDPSVKKAALVFLEEFIRLSEVNWNR